MKSCKMYTCWFQIKLLLTSLRQTRFFIINYYIIHVSLKIKRKIFCSIKRLHVVCFNLIYVHKSFEIFFNLTYKNLMTYFVSFGLFFFE